MKLHCAICGKLLNYTDSTSINYPNKDHIIPVKKGGQKGWTNIQYICKCCEGKKRYSFSKDRKFNLKFVDLDFLLLLIQNEKRNGINFDKENISNLLQYKEDLIKQVNKVDNILKDIT